MAHFKRTQGIKFTNMWEKDWEALDYLGSTRYTNCRSPQELFLQLLHEKLFLMKETAPKTGGVLQLHSSNTPEDAA